MLLGNGKCFRLSWSFTVRSRITTIIIPISTIITIITVNTVISVVVITITGIIVGPPKRA